MLWLLSTTRRRDSRVWTRESCRLEVYTLAPSAKVPFAQDERLKRPFFAAFAPPILRHAIHGLWSEFDELMNFRGFLVGRWRLELQTR